MKFTNSSTFNTIDFIAAYVQGTWTMGLNDVEKRVVNHDFWRNVA
jgi:hypothetical protein